MEVKDIQGKTLIDAPITESAVITEELMRQYSITLGWDAISADVLPLGSYIEHNGVRYSLLAPYSPQQRDETTYEYKPVFEHPVMRWQYLPFFHYTYSGGSIVSKEPDWSLTDNAANFMAAVCAAIKEQTGEDWSYEIADNLPASGDLSFSNTDIFSALTSIAGKFETEWWFDYASKTIYLSKASHGSEVSLEVGRNIGIPSTTQSRDSYATRFYVFGSTRNIEQNYAGSNVNSIVNKRLTLNPAKYPNGYIDIREGLTDSEILVKTLTFDDVYPRSALTISDLKVRLMWRLDSDNQKVQIGTDANGNAVYDQYAIWYFKVPGFSFNKDMVISGKALSVHFNDGPLSGREFELTYHDKDKDVETSDGTSIHVDAGSFEINFVEEGTYIIPSITGLVPVEGNKVTLFNIRMPEEYKSFAYDELEQVAKKEIAKQNEDLSNYSFNSNPVDFFMNNPGLSVGQKVVYKNGSYSYSTRVIKLETQLDRPYEQKITIGSEQIKGNTQTLKEDVVSANQNIDLIASINESTQQLVQSYQKTQKALQESMAVWGNLWKLDPANNAVRTPFNLISDGTIAMKQLGAPGDSEIIGGIQRVRVYFGEDADYIDSDANGNIRLPAYPTALKNPHALKINGVAYDGSKDIEINISANGGIADSVAWENVFGRPTNLSEFTDDLTPSIQEWVIGKHYLTSIPDEYVTDTELNNKGYATENWVSAKGYAVATSVANTYATKTALESANTNISNLGTKVATIEKTIETEQGYIDILQGYFTNGIANNASKLNGKLPSYYATSDSLNNLGGRVDTLYGYFANGVANNAAKLDGQLPSYYATAASVTALGNRAAALEGYFNNGIAKEAAKVTQSLSFGKKTYNGSSAQSILASDLDAVTIAGAQTITGAKTFSAQLTASEGILVPKGKSVKIGGSELVWDDTMQALKIIGSAYVTGTLAMKQLSQEGTEGGGGTGGATAAIRIMLGEDPYDAKNGVVSLPAYPVIPASLKNPYSLTFGTKSYDGSAAKTITASDLGALTSHQDISHLLSKTDAAATYLPKSGGTIIGRTNIKLDGFPFIAYYNSSTFYGFIGFSDVGVPSMYNGTSWNTLYHTGNFNPANYLSLNGGTITGSTAIPLIVNTTNSQEVGIRLAMGEVSKGFLGYNPSEAFGIYLYNTTTGYRLGIRDNGDLYYYSDRTNYLIHEGNYADTTDKRYLQLSGGTLTGTLEVSQGNLLVSEGHTITSHLYPKDHGVSMLGQGGRRWADVQTVLINGGIPIHANNISSYKAGDSNKLDGLLSDSYAKCGYNHVSTDDVFTALESGMHRWSGTAINMPNGGAYGNSLVVRGNRSIADTAWILYGNYSSQKLFYANGVINDGVLQSSWKEIAFTDSDITGNAASATKLQDNTAYTAWGQTFFENGVPKNINNQSIRVWKSLSSSGGWARGIFAADSQDNSIANIGFHGNGDELIYTYIVSGARNSEKGIYIHPDGNVTINSTNNNGAKLQVNGGVIRNVLSLNSNHFGGPIVFQTHNGVSKTWWGYSPTLQGVYLFNQNDKGLFISDNNNVLIGTTADRQTIKLNVNGTVMSNLSSASNDAMFYGERTDLGYLIGFGIGTSSNRGIYDSTLGWCFKIDTSHNLTILGHTVSGNLAVTGTTTTNTLKIGSATLSYNDKGWLEISGNVVVKGTLGMLELGEDGSASGASGRLVDLTDVKITTPLQGQALIYDEKKGWINGIAGINQAELNKTLASYALLTDVDNRINALVNGAPAAYDTLKEIADVLQGNVNSIGDILTALDTKLSKTEAANTYQTKITASNKLAYSLISGTPSLATVATSGKYSDLSGVPASLPASDVYAWAKAATKPTYTASEVGALSTSGGTLTGNLQIGNNDNTAFNYLQLVRSSHFARLNSSDVRAMLSFGAYNNGTATIEKALWLGDNGLQYVVNNTAVYDVFHTGNFNPSDYLPLSGGTISASGWNKQLGVNRTEATGAVLIGFYNNNTFRGGLGFNAANSPVYSNTNGESRAILTQDNYSSYALPISGGTISKASYVPLVIQNTASDLSTILFKGSSGELGYLGFNGVGVPTYMTATGVANTLIHSGNIGSQSVAKADYATSALRLVDSQTRGVVYASSNTFYVGDNIFSTLSTHILGKDVVLRYGASATNGLILNTSGNVTIGSSDLASTTTKLYIDGGIRFAPRTIWGQSFDGSGDVSGDLILANEKRILTKDTNGDACAALYLSNLNNLLLGFGTSMLGYTTNVQGNEVWLNYGTNHAVGFILNSYGNITIGASDLAGTTYRLYVNGDGAIKGALFVGDDNGGQIHMKRPSANYIWATSNSGYLALGVFDRGGLSRATSSMIITANEVCCGTNGAIALGTSTNRWGKLYCTDADFNGSVKIGSAILSYNSNGWLNVSTNLVSDGTIGMYEIASTSDRKLKDNIEEISAEQSLSIIRQLRPTSWDWKRDGKKAYGLIAQEVEPIVPEMVNSLGDTLHLQYNQLHAFEIGAIKKIDNDVEKLKKDLKKANNKIEKLESELKQYRQWQ